MSYNENSFDLTSPLKGSQKRPGAWPPSHTPAPVITGITWKKTLAVASDVEDASA